MHFHINLLSGAAHAESTFSVPALPARNAVFATVHAGHRHARRSPMLGSAPRHIVEYSISALRDGVAATRASHRAASFNCARRHTIAERILRAVGESSGCGCGVLDPNIADAVTSLAGRIASTSPGRSGATIPGVAGLTVDTVRRRGTRRSMPPPPPPPPRLRLWLLPTSSTTLEEPSLG